MTETTVSRVRRVRHEIRRRPVTVARVETITPHVRRIVFHGEALADFASASFDDHVKFIVDGDAAPDRAATGPVMRDYTPRRFDPVACELAIEFALHGDGPAGRWAAQAAPGQRATIAGPKGSMVVPPDWDWQLLAGDETALPAIARRLEELPGGTRVTVIACVGDTADRRDFPSAADVTVRWVGDDDALIDAVRAFDLPPGDGYVWCAGEARTMAALRRIVVDDKGHDRHAIRAAAYWKRGVTAHHENLDG